MPCLHRFYDNLIPDQNPLHFIIIGTFNPSWNAVNGNNADFFYGRATNLFWCICPHAFNDECLIDRGVNEWIDFCTGHCIGLTDIIRNVVNASDENPLHVRLLTSGFEDKNLDLKEAGQFVFQLDFNTDAICDLITRRKSQVKGVFFTRKSHNDIPRIWEEWKKISRHCDLVGIPNAALPTPSSRGGAIRDKILTWRQEIQNCM
jgi:hypothetical protein